jgi:hypothetical protein
MVETSLLTEVEAVDEGEGALGGTGFDEGFSGG